MVLLEGNPYACVNFGKIGSLHQFPVAVSDSRNPTLQSQTGCQFIRFGYPGQTAGFSQRILRGVRIDPAP
jgi:hypothetical protein